jgi:FKBP-type peptidyl-prolyl cis-trans isomerase (trigger factor)
MKTEVKKIDTTKREISIAVTGETLKNKFEEVYKKIGQEAKVPGFRPGNAPRDILEKHFSSQVRQRVIEELIPDVYSKAVEKEGLEVIDLPNISEVRLDNQAEALSFKATVEVRPEINLKGYKKIKVNYKKTAVALDEIKRHLEALKEARKVDSLDDNFAKRLGYAALSELEKAIEKQIFMQKDNLQRQKIENEMLQDLTKDLDFKIPDSLIKRQLEDLVRQTKLDLALKGVAREEIEAEVEKLRQDLGPQAKKQVKIYLVLAEIAKRENIAMDDHMPHQVIEFLLQEADWQEAS